MTTDKKVEAIYAKIAALPKVKIPLPLFLGDRFAIADELIQLLRLVEYALRDGVLNASTAAELIDGSLRLMFEPPGDSERRLMEDEQCSPS